MLEKLITIRICICSCLPQNTCLFKLYYFQANFYFSINFIVVIWQFSSAQVVGSLSSTYLLPQQQVFYQLL